MKHKATKRAAALALSAVLAGTAVPLTVSADTPTVVSIDPRERFQEFEGWGTSLCWWGNVVGGWKDKVKTDEILDLVFDEEKGLGLNIARYNIGGGENPEHSHMRNGGDVPGFEPEPGVYDWNADAGQRYVLLGAMERGVDITEAFLNSPPYWMTESQCTAGSLAGITNNLKDEYTDEFVDYMTEVVKFYRDEYGVTFRTLSPFNESSTPFSWHKGYIQEGCFYSPAKQNEVINKLGKALEEKGLTGTTIGAPEENFIDWTIDRYNGYDDSAKNYISQLNTHTYHGTERAQMKTLALGEKKNLWMSEVGFGGSLDHEDHNDMSASLQLAHGINMDLKYMQPNAWVYWQVVEEEINDSNWGMIHADYYKDTEDYALTKLYYSFANYTKFIRPGYQFIGAGRGNNNVVGAYDEDTGRVVFVVMNDANSPVNYQYDLSQFASTASSVQVYRTSPTQNLEQLENIEITEGGFTNEAPAQSVTTFVLDNAVLSGSRILNDADEGSGENQFQYEGNWSYTFEDTDYGWDNHYSSTVGDTCTVAFQGTQFKISGAKDLNYGYMGISIDGGPETTVNCYGWPRKGEQMLYESPILESGPHTLTIRVTGKKGPVATGHTISIDRVDILE